MKAEAKAIDALSSLVMRHHEKDKHSESWGEGYEYLSIEYSGPFIDEDTGKPDEDCIMYLVSVDAYLIDRLEAEDKTLFPKQYDNLYGWVFVASGGVDIVGIDNFHGDDREKVIKNLTVFFKHYKNLNKINS